MKLLLALFSNVQVLSILKHTISRERYAVAILYCINDVYQPSNTPPPDRAELNTNGPIGRFALYRRVFNERYRV